MKDAGERLHFFWKYYNFLWRYYNFFSWQYPFIPVVLIPSSSYF